MTSYIVFSLFRDILQLFLGIVDMVVRTILPFPRSLRNTILLSIDKDNRFHSPTFIDYFKLYTSRSLIVSLYGKIAKKESQKVIALGPEKSNGISYVPIYCTTTQFWRNRFFWCFWNRNAQHSKIDSNGVERWVECCSWRVYCTTIVPDYNVEIRAIISASSLSRHKSPDEFCVFNSRVSRHTRARTNRFREFPRAVEKRGRFARVLFFDYDANSLTTAWQKDVGHGRRGIVHVLRPRRLQHGPPRVIPTVVVRLVVRYHPP